jgi:hypothetical protein
VVIDGTASEPPMQPLRLSHATTVISARGQAVHLEHLTHKGDAGRLLGRVEAPDEETAIRKAIDQFEIEPALRKRLLAQRR